MPPAEPLQEEALERFQRQIADLKASLDRIEVAKASH
jgi:hypothetical protein